MNDVSPNVRKAAFVSILLCANEEEVQSKKPMKEEVEMADMTVMMVMTVMIMMEIMMKVIMMKVIMTKVIMMIVKVLLKFTVAMVVLLATLTASAVNAIPAL
jgi:hypothetical protein